MNLDIIVAVLGIISAIVGLLTAIIQLKNATYQRRHQESQGGRNYIDIGIGKWLKRALVLFGVPFAVLLAYREWESVENAGNMIWGAANNATSLDVSITSFEEQSWRGILKPHQRYRIRIPSSVPEYRYTCPGFRSEMPGYPNPGERNITASESGEIVFWTKASKDNPQGNGGEFIVGEETTLYARIKAINCSLEQGSIIKSTTVSVQMIPVGK